MNCPLPASLSWCVFRRICGVAIAATGAAVFGAFISAAPSTQTTGTWDSVGALVEARVSATATPLGNGRVLIVNGGTAEVLDASGASSAVASLNIGRTGHAAAPLPDGRAIVTGGTTADGSATATAEIFDGSSWTLVPMTTARTRHTATLSGAGLVIVAGGDVAGASVASIEIFDPGSNAFVPSGATMSSARSRHAAAMLTSGAVLVAGGWDGTSALGSTEIIAANGAGSSASGSMNSARTNFTMTELLDGSLLVVGGTSGPSAERYDAVTGGFSPVPGMSYSRNGHVAVRLEQNNGVLVTGGGSTTSEIYKPTSGFFVLSTSTAFPHNFGVAGEATPGRAIVAGGGSATVEAYRHATLTTDKDDYAPGETVTMSGTGWMPGELVTLVLREANGPHSDRTFFATADGTGNIANAEFIPELHHNGVRFLLTAYGAAGEALHTFTDANPQTISVAAPTTVTVIQGSTAHYGAVTLTVGGNSNPCSVTLSAIAGTGTGLPASAAAQFGTNPLNTTGQNVTTSLSVTTSTSTPPGTYTFQIIGKNGGDGCQGPGASPSNQLRLIVDAGATALAFTSAATAGTIHQCLGPISVQSRTAEGAPISVADDTAVALATDGTGTLYGDASCSASIAGVTIAAGTDTASFYYKATQRGSGTHTLTASAAALTSATQPQTINKATATIDVDGFSGTYDGDAHGATGTATGVAGEDLTSLLDLGSTFTDVPGGTANWTFAGNGDYEAAQGSVEINITKATATIQVQGKTTIYNGNPHGATGTAKGVKGEDLSEDLDLGQTFTNVPGGQANWTFSGGTNYEDANGGVEIVITRANATIDVQGFSGTYDGDPHGATGSAKGVKGETLAGLDLGASFTNVPGGTATWTFTDVTGNYNNTGGTVTITIGKANATIDVQGYSGTYDGDPHGAIGSAKGVKGETLAGLDLGASFTNVPGGTATWTFTDVTGNYNNTGGTVAITIGKANATIDVQGFSGTYDGDPHSATGSAKGVKGETLAGLDLGASFTDVPGGSANWTFTDVTGNYNNTSGTVAITIGKANATIDVQGLSGTYDGDPHGATGSAKGVKGETLAGLDLGASFTDVPGGAATWTFTDATGNYNNANGSVEITISKANATIDVQGFSGTYDGDPHGATGSAKGVKGETLAGLDLGSSFTNVPGGAATWTFTDVTGNYNNTGGTVAITIGKANATIDVQGFSGTYDGDAHGATGSAKGVKGETLAGLDLGASFTDVPGGSATWTFTDVTGNYNNTSGTVAITIGKANATIDVQGFSGTYDGDPHGATGSAKGVKGETLAGLDLGASFTDVPGGSATWTFTDATGNYNNTGGTLDITISKANATIDVQGFSGTYDGQAHGANGSVTGVKGESLSGLNLGASFTNVPGGTAYWTFAGGTNYHDANGSVAIAIAKANPTIVVDGYSGVFDGQPHGATGSATGVLGETLPGLNLGASFTFVPGGTAHWTFAGGTNYYDDSGSVAVTILTACSAFNGFLPPIGGSVETGGGGSFGNPVRSFKLNSTIPVKFGATCYGAPLTTGVQTLQAIKYSNATTSDDPIDATPTDSPTPGNQFRLSGTEWHFNLSTKALGTGAQGIWLLKARLFDGSTYSVWVEIKK